MSQLYRKGSIVALLNAVLGAAMLLVVFTLIGIEAFADRRKLIDLAINRPWPLILQDILKFLSLFIMLMLVQVMYRILKPFSPKTQKVAATFGMLGILAMFLNESLSLYAIYQASNSSVDAATGHRLNMIIALLGFVVLLMTGLWYLLVNWSVLKEMLLPKWVGYLGIATGALFLMPPLGIVAGLCSIAWSVAVYIYFKQKAVEVSVTSQ